MFWDIIGPTPTWDIMSLKLYIKMSHVVFLTDPKCVWEPVSLTPTELTDFTMHPHLSKSIPSQSLYIYIYRHNDTAYTIDVCGVCVCIPQQIFCSNFPAQTGRMDWTGTNLVLQRWGEPHQKPSRAPGVAKHCHLSWIKHEAKQWENAGPGTTQIWLPQKQKPTNTSPNN